MKRMTGGSWAVFLVCVAACSGTTIVGSKFVKTLAVSAAQGGEVVVSSTDDPKLAGLEIVIPANALAKDTTITVAEAAELSASQRGETTQVGTTADLGPSGTQFAVPATITLPFAVPTDSDVSVVGVEADGTVFTVAGSDLSFDASNSHVTFAVKSFTQFGVVYRHHVEEVDDGGVENDLDAGFSCLAFNVTSLVFGDVGVNDAGAFCTSANQVFSVKNTCAGDATLQSLVIETGDAISNFTTPAGPPLPLVISAGSSSDDFEMYFDPTLLGVHSGDLVASDGLKEATMALIGTAVSTVTCGGGEVPDAGEATDGGESTDGGSLDGGQPATCLAFNLTTLSCPDVGENNAGVLCTGDAQVFSISNTCDTPVTLESFFIRAGPGDLVPQFSTPVGPSVPSVIPAGSSPEVYEIYFEPTSLGLHTASLVASDGTAETSMGLSGTAVSTISCN